ECLPRHSASDSSQTAAERPVRHSVAARRNEENGDCGNVTGRFFVLTVWVARVPSSEPVSGRRGCSAQVPKTEPVPTIDLSFSDQKCPPGNQATVSENGGTESGERPCLLLGNRSFSRQRRYCVDRRMTLYTDPAHRSSDLELEVGSIVA